MLLSRLLPFRGAFMKSTLWKRKQDGLFTAFSSAKQEPYVYVPNFLKSQPENTIPELPEPGLSAGKAVVNGYLLGYDTRMGVDMLLTYTDKLFPNTWKNNVTVRQDGSFHAEIDMLQPDTVHLSVNKAILPIFLVPEEEVTIYVSLPRLSMAASSLLEDKYRRKQKAWFDGAAEIINTELATTGNLARLEIVPSGGKRPDTKRCRKIGYQERQRGRPPALRTLAEKSDTDIGRPEGAERPDFRRHPPIR